MQISRIDVHLSDFLFCLNEKATISNGFGYKMHAFIIWPILQKRRTNHAGKWMAGPDGKTDR